MSRIRTIKPEFFINDKLAELTTLTRLLFIGLWTLADCEGRMEDRPKRIRAQIHPFDDGDTDAMLQALHDHGFIQRYTVGGLRCIEILGFRKHQRLSGKESEGQSVIPPREKSGSDGEATGKHRGSDGEATGKHRGSDGEAAVAQERKGKERKGEKTNSPNGEYGDAGAPPPAPPRVVALDRTPYAAIVALYHEILPELRECRSITPGRRGYLRQRWRDKPGPDLAAWRRYFAYVRTSPFLMGQLAGRDGRPPFQADLEWLIKPGNFAKVIEGKFDAAEPVARHG